MFLPPFGLTCARCYFPSATFGLTQALLFSFRHNLAEVSNDRKLVKRNLKQRESIRPHSFIVNHDHNFIEK
jgi:hypothetical protein